MNENGQNREALFNDHPGILKKEPVINAQVTHPDAVYSMTVQEYFDRGNTKIEQQDFEGATAYFSHAIEISSDNSMVHIQIFGNP